ncbi:hypothetical protein [Streptosporangium sp. NPDC006930]|uniref:hypothetical protein n=1 Tax=Streptosporangium sp. NPDC006930 TaxID=3154783 RepID=UPI003445CAE5
MPEQYPPTSKVRSWQEQTALVLAALLRHDLPSATWTITDVLFATHTGEMDGQVSGTDEECRAKLDAWSAQLGAPVVWSPLHPNSTTLSGRVNVEINGVRVEVWTHVTAPEGGAV